MSLRILIVEDELLIAHMLERFLMKKGYDVVDIAVSYEEAIEMIATHQPQVALLDIRLNGEKSGIDIAKTIKEKALGVKYLFLTSQMDMESLEAAKITLPAGYLSKPVQKESLFASLEMLKFQMESKKVQICLPADGKSQLVDVEGILFLQSDHVYTNVVLKNKKTLVVRMAMKDLVELLPEDRFIQSHRSYIVNIEHVDRWDKANLYIQEEVIPISRSNKELITKKLNALKGD